MRIFVATLLIARHAIAQSARGLRLLALSLLAIVPLLIAAGIVLMESTVRFSTFASVTLLVSFQVIIPLLALILGVSVLGDEIEGRTLTYLYTRPLPRPVYYVGRLLGIGCFYALILAVSLGGSAAMFGSELDFGFGAVVSATAIGLAAFFVYLAIFAAIRTLMKPALYAGFLLIFVVEGLVSKIPDSGAAQLTVWRHALILFAARFDEFRFPCQFRSMAESGDPTTSVWTLAAIFVGALAAAVIRLQTTEQRLPAAVA